MLDKLPHKNLFYFGFLIVFVFIGLSYWQLTRHQQDKLIINSIDSKDYVNEISVSDLYDLNYKFEEFTKIQLTENLENIDWAKENYETDNTIAILEKDVRSFLDGLADSNSSSNKAMVTFQNALLNGLKNIPKFPNN